MEYSFRNRDGMSCQTIEPESNGAVDTAPGSLNHVASTPGRILLSPEVLAAGSASVGRSSGPGAAPTAFPATASVARSTTWPHGSEPANVQPMMGSQPPLQQQKQQPQQEEEQLHHDHEEELQSDQALRVHADDLVESTDDDDFAVWDTGFCEADDGGAAAAAAAKASGRVGLVGNATVGTAAVRHVKVTSGWLRMPHPSAPEMARRQRHDSRLDINYRQTHFAPTSGDESESVPASTSDGFSDGAVDGGDYDAEEGATGSIPHYVDPTEMGLPEGWRCWWKVRTGSTEAGRRKDFRYQAPDGRRFVILPSARAHAALLVGARTLGANATATATASAPGPAPATTMAGIQVATHDCDDMAEGRNEQEDCGGDGHSVEDYHDPVSYSMNTARGHPSRGERRGSRDRCRSHPLGLRDGEKWNIVRHAGYHSAQHPHKRRTRFSGGGAAAAMAATTAMATALPRPQQWLPPQQMLVRWCGKGEFLSSSNGLDALAAVAAELGREERRAGRRDGRRPASLQIESRQPAPPPPPPPHRLAASAFIPQITPCTYVVVSPSPLPPRQPLSSGAVTSSWTRIPPAVVHQARESCNAARTAAAAAAAQACSSPDQLFFSASDDDDGRCSLAIQSQLRQACMTRARSLTATLPIYGNGTRRSNDAGRCLMGGQLPSGALADIANNRSLYERRLELTLSLTAGELLEIALASNPRNRNSTAESAGPLRLSATTRHALIAALVPHRCGGKCHIQSQRNVPHSGTTLEEDERLRSVLDAVVELIGNGQSSVSPPPRPPPAVMIPPVCTGGRNGACGAVSSGWSTTLATSWSAPSSAGGCGGAGGSIALLPPKPEVCTLSGSHVAPSAAAASATATDKVPAIGEATMGPNIQTAAASQLIPQTVFQAPVQPQLQPQPPPTQLLQPPPPLRILPMAPASLLPVSIPVIPPTASLPRSSTPGDPNPLLAGTGASATAVPTVTATAAAAASACQAGPDTATASSAVRVSEGSATSAHTDTLPPHPQGAALLVEHQVSAASIPPGGNTPPLSCHPPALYPAFLGTGASASAPLAPISYSPLLLPSLQTILVGASTLIANSAGPGVVGVTSTSGKEKPLGVDSIPTAVAVGSDGGAGGGGNGVGGGDGCSLSNVSAREGLTAGSSTAALELASDVLTVAVQERPSRTPTPLLPPPLPALEIHPQSAEHQKEQQRPVPPALSESEAAATYPQILCLADWQDHAAETRWIALPAPQHQDLMPSPIEDMMGGDTTGGTATAIVEAGAAAAHAQTSSLRVENSWPASAIASARAGHDLKRRRVDISERAAAPEPLPMTPMQPPLAASFASARAPSPARAMYDAAATAKARFRCASPSHGGKGNPPESDCEGSMGGIFAARQIKIQNQTQNQNHQNQVSVIRKQDQQQQQTLPPLPTQQHVLAHQSLPQQQQPLLPAQQALGQHAVQPTQMQQDQQPSRHAFNQIVLQHCQQPQQHQVTQQQQQQQAGMAYGQLQAQKEQGQPDQQPPSLQQGHHPLQQQSSVEHQRQLLFVSHQNQNNQQHQLQLQLQHQAQQIQQQQHKQQPSSAENAPQVLQQQQQQQLNPQLLYPSYLQQCPIHQLQQQQHQQQLLLLQQLQHQAQQIQQQQQQTEILPSFEGGSSMGIASAAAAAAGAFQVRPPLGQGYNPSYHGHASIQSHAHVHMAAMAAAQVAAAAAAAGVLPPPHLLPALMHGHGLYGACCTLTAPSPQLPSAVGCGPEGLGAAAASLTASARSSGLSAGAGAAASAPAATPATVVSAASGMGGGSIAGGLYTAQGLTWPGLGMGDMQGQL